MGGRRKRGEAGGEEKGREREEKRRKGEGRDGRGGASPHLKYFVMEPPVVTRLSTMPMRSRIALGSATWLICATLLVTY